MRTIQKFFLVFFGFFLAFVVVETGLRIFGFSGGIYQIDKNTGFITLKPNKEFFWIKDCFKNLVKTNSLGFHDSEFNKEKSQNVFRIVVLGDSYVEALQVPRDKTFYNLLEHKLNNKLNSERKYEVFAFGRSGNGTLLNYLYLKNYALQYQPDLVINAFLVGNDFRDDNYELTKQFSQQTGDTVVLQRPFPLFDDQNNINLEATETEYIATTRKSKTFIRKIVSKSALAGWLYQKLLLIKYKIYKQKKEIVGVPGQIGNRNTANLNKIPVDKQVYLIDYPEVWQKAWQTDGELLKEIKTLSEHVGAKFLLVSLTEGFRIHQDNKKPAFDFDKPERLLAEISKNYQFSYLPLVPIFRERFIKEKKITTFSCDGHWNETGHQWAAEAIFEHFREHPELLTAN